MTRLSSISAILLPLALAIACSKADGGSPTAPDGEVVLNLHAPVSATTRTWLDADGSGTEVPVYWSDGDRISVNGVTSSPLAVEDGEKFSSAEFSLRNVSAPYSVVYPHSACIGTEEDGSVILDIPAVQEWTEGSFASGSALLYGYGASEEEAVEMHNLCGAISFTLRDADEVAVSSLTLTSLSDGKPIAGRFTLDTGTLALSPSGQGSSTLTMSFPEDGVKIASEGTSFYFSIPAGSYPDGFLIRLDDARKHILRSYWLRPSEGAEAGVTLQAGKLVVFAPMDYDPDAREICSAADWEEFASALNASEEGWEKEWLGKDGSVKIGADFSAESLSKLSTLAVPLEGNGHTITISVATSPLVGRLTGSIRNLTIAGTNTPSDPGNAGATVFVTTLAGGSIENCTNRAAIKLSGHEGKMVGAVFARTFSGGSITDCTNYGSITISCNLENSNQAILIGGIAGTVSTISGTGLIKGCTNKGDIKLTLAKPAGNYHFPVQAGYGGIVGTIVSGDASNYIRIEDCTNEGGISVDNSADPSSSAVVMAAAGGIVGTAMKYNGSSVPVSSSSSVPSGGCFSWWTRSSVLGDTFPDKDGVYFEMKNCTCTGDVHNGLICSVSSDDPVKIFTAGLIGVANGLKDKHIKIEDCKFTGKIIPYEGSTYSRASLATVSAGLAGFAGYADFTRCTVSSAQIGTLKKQAYATAGAIGLAPMSFTLTDCKVFAELRHIRVTNYTDQNYAIGFSLSTKNNSLGGIRWPMIDLEGSSVSGCKFGGSVTYNPTAVAYNATSGFSTVETLQFTESNVAGYIASQSFGVDHFGKGFPSQVSITGNAWWDGK